MTAAKFRVSEPMTSVDRMTVFNTDQVDTTKQKMFFGQPLGVQRYDKFKYPIFDKLTQTQLGFFWRPEEVSLQKDRADYQTLNDAQKHIFTSNLKYQILLDSVQGRGPGMALCHTVHYLNLRVYEYLADYGDDPQSLLHPYHQKCIPRSLCRL